MSKHEMEIMPRSNLGVCSMVCMDYSQDEPRLIRYVDTAFVACVWQALQTMNVTHWVLDESNSLGDALTVVPFEVLAVAIAEQVELALGVTMIQFQEIDYVLAFLYNLDSDRLKVQERYEDVPTIVTVPV